MLTLAGEEPLDNNWIWFIEECYSEPARAYHTLSHIQSMLSLLQRYEPLIEDKLSVKLSILFHELSSLFVRGCRLLHHRSIVYDPQATHGSNELKSIDVFGRFASEKTLSDTTTTRVTEMIQATIGHQIPNSPQSTVSQTDIGLFLDFDLEVLSRSPEEYQLYASQIRREYSHFPDDAYSVGRTKVLESFLGRDRLYFTDVFHSEKEATARANLQNEINILKTS